jgi:putative tricarboxylic transport membrane protein
VRFLKTPRQLLIPIIIVIAAVGSFSINYNMIDLYVILILGVVGYVLRKLDFSLASLLVGLVLGPLIEKYFREGMFISGGDPLYFVSTPISAGIWIVVVAVLLGGGIVQVLRRQRAARRARTGVTESILLSDD